MGDNKMTIKIENHEINIQRAQRMMGGNETDPQVIWEWILDNAKHINFDKYGNIIGWEKVVA